MTQMSADASRGVPIRRQPTRVLYLDHVAAPSGAEFALVRLLADLDPDLVTPTVVFASDGPMVERVRALDVDTHVLPLASAVRDVRKDAVGRAMLLRAATAGVGLGAYVRRIARFARERHIDLIHTNSMKAHLYGGLAGRLAGVPVVWHLRDYVDPTYLPPTTVRGVRAAARVLPRGVVAVSGSVLERLRLPARVAGRVVHDGLTTEELRPRRRGGGKATWPTPARIGMVGRISAWKGQHVLLDAAAQILAAGHDARFVVVGAPLFGEEDYAASLQDQARRLGIADRVDFVGFRSNVDATLSELDVLVHASTSPDPFPNTVLEGMAAGLPLVASRGGGVTEMIEHGVSGRLAEMGSGDSLAEELDAVLTNFAGARRMGDAAYGRVREQFTGVRTARAVEAFYETVLSTAPPRGNAVPLRPAAVKAGRRQLRCLLFSPLPPLDPENGDAQYTRGLLEDPPDGVTYVHYADALRTGALEEGPSLRPGRRGPRSPADVASAAARSGLHAARRAGWLLPDPVRWLRVRDHFDVVHVHCMPVRFLGPTPPVVATDSAGTFWYWTAARGIPEARVDRLLRRERRLARAFGYLHPTANPEAAHSLLLFVASGRELLARVGVDPGWIKLCPVGVPPPLAHVERPGRSGSSILFVARDFALKGGATAVDVLRRVRRVLPDARLLVAGSAEPDPGIDGVEWIGPTTREELYRSVYPRADVLLYPTTFDTASLVVTEALAHGVPVVAPAAFCLPDLVLDGRTGVLYPPDDVAAATDAVLALLTDPRRLARMRRHAVEDYGSRLSPEVRNDVLLAAYRRAAGRAGPSRR